MAEKDLYKRRLEEIIQEQKDLENEEKVREQASKAGIQLDEDLNVKSFDESGEKAVNNLVEEITGKRTNSGQKTDENKEDTENRQEYYLNSIQKIVEDQKDFLGEEAALKQVRQAPVKLDSEGNVTGFYGKGEKALETLREFTENQEFYLKVINKVVNAISNFFGQKFAIKYARKAPLQINPEGKVQAYYGKGRKALEILVENFENDIGKEIADKRIRKSLSDIDKENYKLLPERIRPKPQEEKDRTLDKIKDIFHIN